MDKEFELFIREKRFVQNASEHTLEFYRYSFQAFKKHCPAGDLDKLKLVSLVASMRESGMSAACTDARIRGINPFLTWLFENNLTTEHLKIRRQKIQKRVIKTFTEAQVKSIINYKPKDQYERRLHTLMLLLFDTGIRINEALTLERRGVDLDNLLISVIGKGNKERIVPFSIELRKTLFKYLKTHNFELVFSCRHGGKLLYNNVRRDFNKLIAKLGITGFDGTFHAARRCFATNYIKENGNPLKLQRMLGHTTLKQTNEYVKMVTDDLRQEQGRTSLLNKYR